LSADERRMRFDEFQVFGLKIEFFEDGQFSLRNFGVTDSKRYNY